MRSCNSCCTMERFLTMLASKELQLWESQHKKDMKSVFQCCFNMERIQWNRIIVEERRISWLQNHIVLESSEYSRTSQRVDKQSTLNAGENYKPWHLFLQMNIQTFCWNHLISHTRNLFFRRLPTRYKTLIFWQQETHWLLIVTETMQRLRLKAATSTKIPCIRIQAVPRNVKASFLVNQLGAATRLVRYKS